MSAVPEALPIDPDYYALPDHERAMVDLAIDVLRASKRLGVDPGVLLEEFVAKARRQQFRVIDGGRA